MTEAFYHTFKVGLGLSSASFLREPNAQGDHRIAVVSRPACHDVPSITHFFRYHYF